jgi:YebC/PmpR family DNA-binding regulatory protein
VVQVKRLKGALDQKRGKLFSKLAKEITVAAKTGGDPASNPRLRAAVLAARAQSMPNENIERAIQRGTGEEADAAAYEELVYEGYGPGGVALLIEAATDNKNRTAADLRLIFSKNHGHLGSSGSVAYLFRRKGHIVVPRDATDDEKLLELTVEAGAEDMNSDEASHVVITSHDRLYSVAETLRAAGVAVESQKLTYNPDSTIEIGDEQTASQIVRLCEALEESDDVQNVYTNFELTEAVLEKVSG